jgi:hypothetical protein
MCAGFRQVTADAVEQWIVRHRVMRPNVEGNRRATLTLAEDQGMNRRVRLTVRLGPWDLGKEALHFITRGNQERNSKT